MNFAKSLAIVFLIFVQLIGQPSSVIAASLNNDLNSFDKLSMHVLAQTPETYTNRLLKQTNKDEAWVPPDGDVSEGFWARLLGLGRRGSCSDLTHPLIALVPTLLADDINTVENLQLPSGNGELMDVEFAGQGVTLTLSSQPNFWFYIPKQARDAKRVELMIQDINGDDLVTLDNPIKANIKTGLVSFQPPADLVDFEPNQPYHWYFSVVCDPDRPSRNPNVDGWIERIDTNALGIDTTKLEQLPPEERLDLYSKFNIWNETVTLLAEKHCLNPQDPTFIEYWNILLDSSLPGVGRDWIDPLTYCVHSGPLTLTG